MPEQFTESLQEAVLAVLAFDQKYGALISAHVLPEHFDGLYNQIAGAVLQYRRKYNKPPGRAHLEDLFSRAKLDPSDRKTHALRSALIGLAQQAESINAEYVAGRAQDFVRSQKLKGALRSANERYLQGGDDAVSDVEGILHTALRFRQTTLDAGTFLSDADAALEFMTRQAEFYSTGIMQLDNIDLGIARKQLLLYIAPKGSGKSWFCVNAGRQSLLQKAKVCHISLEMDEGRVLARYYQSFFGIARRPDQYTRPVLEFDALERLTGFKLRKNKPKLDFADPGIRKILRGKINHWGARFKRLVIKSFPSGSLTMSQLRGYLDYLELVHKFIPDVLIIDYPDLMKTDADNLRISTGRMFVDLRGLGDERNMAVVAPTQSNRAGIGAKRVSSASASEDISKVFTADTVLSYSQTEPEKLLGLARLSVEHARDTETGMQLLLTQSYTTGQYVLESSFLSGSSYWERLKELTGEDIEDQS